LLVFGIVDRGVEIVSEERRVRIGIDRRVTNQLLVLLRPYFLQAQDVGVGARNGLRDVLAALRLVGDEGTRQCNVEGLDLHFQGLRAFTVVRAAG